LAPFQHQQQEHTARQKPIGETSSNIPNFPSTDTFAPQLPAPSQSPSPGRPRQLPKVTSWGDEDIEAINGGNAPPQEESFGSGNGFGGGGEFFVEICKDVVRVVVLEGFLNRRWEICDRG
jgi:type II secretory pathway pseudopilin PulG